MYALKEYMKIDNIHHLRDECLTLAEYRELFYVLCDLRAKRTSRTLSQNVANWCQRHRLSVRKKDIGFIINY